MAEIEFNFEDDLQAEEEVAPAFTREDIERAKKDVASRCQQAELGLKEQARQYGLPTDRQDDVIKLGMKCGRDVRWLGFWNEEIIRLSSINFEKYILLGDYDAICCYKDRYIEAALNTIRPTSRFVLFRRFFKIKDHRDKSFKVDITPEQASLPRLQLSHASEDFLTLHPGRERLSFWPTIKFIDCNVATHDQALSFLESTANSLFFQIDLLSDVGLGLERERTRQPMPTRPVKRMDWSTEVQYPKKEYDQAPISLYWYARSAAGMPLLQFLAFYQVIEFYFPFYSRAEAHRRLKAILKDPTFRGDRDSDVGKLLSAINSNSGNSFGSERDQLRATLAECVDADELRTFLEAAPDRKAFYSEKGKEPLYHKIPLANPSADLRNDVADRTYDIRCKIVHSKNDSRDGQVELLPFSKEAARLGLDIDLV